MRPIKYIVFLLFVASSLAQAQWEIQLDIQNFIFLDRIHFIDENRGWAIGSLEIGAGPYFYTTDGGENWYVYEDWMAMDNWGTDIVFVNPDTGFIAAPNGIIHKTVNGGETWTAIQTPATQDVMRLFFVDENNGWATLGSWSEGHLLKTENCGSTWEIIDSETDGTISIYFLDEDIGWLSSELGPPISHGVILKSIDGGNNFITQYNCPAHTYIEDIYFVTEQIGWAVGQKSSISTYIILHTTDGGETWTEQAIESTQEPVVVHCVYFVNESTGWIGVGVPGPPYPTGAIYLTRDGGQNWQLQQEFYSEILDIQMLNQDTGWAVGADYIYHTTDGDTIIVNGVNDNVHKEEPFNIFPNPTRGIFTIEIPHKLTHSNCQLQITNITGTIIFQLDKLSALQVIDLSSQSAGIYFLTLKCNTGNQFNSLTKNVIKL